MEHAKNIYTLSSDLCCKGGASIKSIIKEKSVEMSNPVPIGGEKVNRNADLNIHEDKVEPIVENGEVVGIVHKCQCGKSTEIRFDY